MHHDFPKRTIIITWVVGALILAGIAFGVIAHRTEDAPPQTASLEETVVTCGAVTLNNTQLGYYFWSEYSYYLMSMKNQIPATLDVSKSLSSQMYDADTTWQDYILGKTMTTVEETLAMVNAAQEDGFELPANRQAELDGNLASIGEAPLDLGLVNEDGTADIQTHLEQSYGAGASMETLSEYLYHSYLAAAYADHLYSDAVFTAEEVEAYYDQNVLEFSEGGVYKIDEKLATIRIVLQSPTNLTDTTAWENAEKSAQTLYTTWLAEGGNEGDFSAMAAAHSNDTTTRSQGGLMEEISAYNVTGELATWVFEENRQSGDSAVVKAETGWVIAYYVEESDLTLWQKTAESTLRQACFEDSFDAVLKQYPTTVAEAHIALVELENYVQFIPSQPS